MKNFLIILFIIYSSAHSQPDYHCLDINHLNFEDIGELQKDISGKKLILIGEIHHMAANSILQADLLIYLNKKFGIRHLLLEYGRAEAWLYNKYLETGNEKYISYTNPGFNRYSEFLNCWEKIYNYNRFIDPDKRILVHGLDFEREPGLSAALYELFYPYRNEPGVKDIFYKIKARYDTIGIERDTKVYILDLREKLKNLILPEGTERNMINEMVYNNSFYSNLYDRDKFMVESFLKVDTTQEVYFGQFGTGHTRLDNHEWFAGYLNTLKDYQNKILVINLHYEDSYFRANEPVTYAFINDVGFFNKKTIKHNLAFFNNLTVCDTFLYRIIPADKYLEALHNKCQYIFYLRHQMGYTKLK